MVKKVTFVDFRGAIAPIAPSPGSAPGLVRDNTTRQEVPGRNFTPLN